MSDGVAVVAYHCGTATVSESVVDGGLVWDLFHDCAEVTAQECGRGELPPSLRAAMLQQCGTFGVRFPAADRLAVMRVLRGRGLALGGLHDVLANGVTGTAAEMEVLRGQLAAAGVEVVVVAVG